MRALGDEVLGDAAQRALQDIEVAGRLSTDFCKARAFMLLAVTPIAPTLPAVARRALATCDAYMRNAASESDLVAARVACWDEIKTLKCDLPDPRGNKYRLAITAVAAVADFQDPGYFLGYFLDFAVKSGVDSEVLANQLRQHYELVT